MKNFLKIFISCSLIYFLGGCYQKSVFKLSAKGNWSYFPIVFHLKDYDDYRGGGEMEIKIEKQEGGKIEGLFFGVMKKYFRCKKTAGCDRLKIGLDNKKSELDSHLEYWEEVLEYKDVVNGRIIGRYYGGNLFEANLEYIINSEDGEIINDNTKIKGAIKDSKIKGIFTGGRFRKSVWELNIIEN